MIHHSNVYWTSFIMDDQEMLLFASDKGLCYAGFSNESFDDMVNWLEKKIPHARLVQDREFMNPYTKQLKAFMEGERTEFSLPLDLRGTTFQIAVWNALLQIPHGSSRSYSEVADAIYKPSAIRAVGAAIGANPVLVVVPCHRVIGKNGSLTGFRAGLEVKERLISLEKNC